MNAKWNTRLTTGALLAMMLAAAQGAVAQYPSNSNKQNPPPANNQNPPPAASTDKSKNS
jgi:hypothetical protein